MADKNDREEVVEEDPTASSIEPETTVHNEVTDFIAAGVAERDFAINFEDGLIPVGVDDLLAPEAPRSVHFEPTLNDEERLLQNNLQKLLQPPAFAKFAMPPGVSPVVARQQNSRTNSVEETQEEPPAQIRHEDIGSSPSYVQRIGKALFKEQNGWYESAVAHVPGPEIQGYSGMTISGANHPSVACTFGLMGSGLYGEPSLSFVTESFDVAKVSDSETFPRRMALQAEMSTGLVFL
ncbi:hypothetical protein BKA65DRAFT_567372 [Rhexocercosporidium sp. MPI-PUGE-AT-0058]|nr:hypothetical protein BKA65DRAFT_567372 [Rhexocercosporidium sp. MPI-PUGE-AT-0058]